MGIPLLQKLKVGSYLVRQNLAGRKRYPLVLMLEPLFRCNLACAGCGKIDYPDDILNQRISVADALEAVDECGAPVVSIAGGEPLLHKELPEIVKGIIARKKFVYLCTNALLMEKRMKDYEPSPYFVWSVHLDGDKQDHDKSVCQAGTYDRAVAAIKAAKAKGFRVNINCTLFNNADPERMTTLRHRHGGWTSTASRLPAIPTSVLDQQHLNRKTRQLFQTSSTARSAVSSVQPVGHVPFDSRRQPGTYHRNPVGQPGRGTGVRLAKALLPARRGLRQDLQGIDGEYRLGRLRASGHYEKCVDCMVALGLRGHRGWRTPSSIRSRRWASACAV